MKCLLILLVVVHLGNCADEVIYDEGDYNYDEEVPNKRYKKVNKLSSYNQYSIAKVHGKFRFLFVSVSFAKLNCVRRVSVLHNYSRFFLCEIATFIY